MVCFYYKFQAEFLRKFIDIFHFLPEPDSAPVEDMDIYGFTTTQLLKLLRLKVQLEGTGENAVDEVPLLLSKLHNEMAKGETQVRQTIVQIIIHKNIKFSS